MRNRYSSLIRGYLPTAGALVRTLHYSLIAVLLAGVLSITLPRPTWAAMADPAGSAAPDDLLDAGGARRHVLAAAALPDAPHTDTWNALPNRGFLNGQVLAMAAAGDDLYVGGYFSQSGDGALTNLGNIARYDTVTKTWHALPNQGVSSAVYALAVSGSDLYVGGYFSQTGDGALTNLGSIARYNTSTQTWHALPKQGLANEVHTLAVLGKNLYVGGIISQTGDGTITNLGNIIRYNMESAGWFLMPNQGFNHRVEALAVSGGNLYVGGFFNQTRDGALTNLGYLARFDGAFHALANQGLYSSAANGVRALAIEGSNLYVGGGFTQTGDGTLTNLGRIARYGISSNTWSALPKHGLNDTVFALAVDGVELYVGGYLTQTGDGTLTNLGRIACFNTAGNSWSALPNQGLGADGAGVCRVDVLKMDGSDLFVGGGCTNTGDGSLAELGGIARYGIADAPAGAAYLPLVVRQ